MQQPLLVENGSQFSLANRVGKLKSGNGFFWRWTSKWFVKNNEQPAGNHFFLVFLLESLQ